MQRIDLPILSCYRCGHSWTPAKVVVRRCPRCKSIHWDEPKIRVPRGGGGLGIEDILGPHRVRIAQIARRYGARNLRVFGSVARDSASARSDVDLLVDFDWTRKVRALRSVDMARELSDLLGRRVDIATEQSLHWLVQPQVVAEAVPL